MAKRGFVFVCLFGWLVGLVWFVVWLVGGRKAVGGLLVLVLMLLLLVLFLF